MDARTEQVAEAFSRHRFAEVYPFLADDVRWTNHGGPLVEGRDAVVAACEETLSALAEMSTDFREFRTVVGSDAVVVDVIADYVDTDGGRTRVASCDIYDVVGDRITAIASYTVALEA